MHLAAGHAWTELVLAGQAQSPASPSTPAYPGAQRGAPSPGWQRFSRDRIFSGWLVTVVALFVLDRRHVADRGVQPAGVEPVHPRGGGELEVLRLRIGPCGGRTRSCRAR